jgi:hypothetical protein
LISKLAVPEDPHKTYWPADRFRKDPFLVCLSENPQYLPSELNFRATSCHTYENHLKFINT